MTGGEFSGKEISGKMWNKKFQNPIYLPFNMFLMPIFYYAHILYYSGFPRWSLS